ncbi:cobalt-precorrin-4/precorrin-4 C(11)-methyltransferase, partial [Kutzneria sp. 744]|uniref:cobalt-precorrin-4/precorrin-4 C(11)-methyltransferase n=1 Tax=Kutzneria sp. (strain 744) TaxID=345341 RepID=UPI0003EED349
MKSGLVSFVGAGPGAADLITLRGARRLAAADVVVWAPSLVDAECIREHVREDAELIDLSRSATEDLVELFRRAARDKLQVVRMITGDPVLWGAVRDQVDACRRIGVETEIVPGVSQVSAAVSAVGRELTDADQSLILTRVDATALPDATQIRQFAEHGATMGVFVAAARTGQLVEELTEGGYAADTPVVVAYKTTWPDELLLTTTLGELEAAVKQRKLWRHTLFLVGKAMAPGTKARYRRAETTAEPVEEAVDATGERAARRTWWSARAGRTNRIAAAR